LRESSVFVDLKLYRQIVTIMGQSNPVIVGFCYALISGNHVFLLLMLFEKHLWNILTTARLAIHLQVDGANALEIRAVHSPKCIVWCAVVCTYVILRLKYSKYLIVYIFDCILKYSSILTSRGRWRTKSVKIILGGIWYNAI
jgi:hypothetical protein